MCTVPRETLIASRERRGKLLRKQFLPEGLGFEKRSLSRQESGIKNVAEVGIANERSRMPKKQNKTKLWF